ncbi:MAG: hypothetical protein KC441_08450 [Anaerolineales bacterium]|nr:hypothetical protein [Anaerolineales bacterium]
MTDMVSRRSKTLPEVVPVTGRGGYVDALSLFLPVALVITSLIFAGLSASTLLPWRKFAGSGSVLRFLSFLPMLLAAVVFSITLRPNHLVRNFQLTLKANWYLTVLTLLSIPGAVYARFVLALPSSYFTQSFMLLAFFAVYFVLLRVPDVYWRQVQSWLVSTFVFVTMLATIDVFRNVVLIGSKSQPNTILILLMGFVLFFYVTSKWTRFLLLTFLGMLIFFTFKNTAVIAFITIVVGFYLFPKKSLRKVSIYNIIGFTFAAGVVATGALIGYWLLQTQFAGFSTGNTTFRMIIYQYRFEQFLSSPFYGQLFTGETVYTFKSLFNSATVPTHSDWLDVLAQGGLLGMFLFVGVFLRTSFLMIKTRHITIPNDIRSAAIASWVLVSLSAFIIMSLFNSILNTPEIALIFWFMLAFGHRVARFSAANRLRHQVIVSSPVG